MYWLNLHSLILFPTPGALAPLFTYRRLDSKSGIFLFLTVHGIVIWSSWLLVYCWRSVRVCVCVRTHTHVRAYDYIYSKGSRAAPWCL